MIFHCTYILQYCKYWWDWASFTINSRCCFTQYVAKLLTTCCMAQKINHHVLGFKNRKNFWNKVSWKFTTSRKYLVEDISAIYYRCMLFLTCETSSYSVLACTCFSVLKTTVGHLLSGQIYQTSIMFQHKILQEWIPQSSRHLNSWSAKSILQKSFIKAY